MTGTSIEKFKGLLVTISGNRTEKEILDEWAEETKRMMYTRFKYQSFTPDYTDYTKGKCVKTAFRVEIIIIAETVSEVGTSPKRPLRVQDTIASSRQYDGIRAGHMQYWQNLLTN